MKHAAGTQAPTIVTANPGCLLQLRAGAQLHQTGQNVLHVMELLDRSLESKWPAKTATPSARLFLATEEKEGALSSGEKLVTSQKPSSLAEVEAAEPTSTSRD